MTTARMWSALNEPEDRPAFHPFRLRSTLGRSAPRGFAIVWIHRDDEAANDRQKPYLQNEGK